MNENRRQSIARCFVRTLIWAFWVSTAVFFADAHALTLPGTAIPNTASTSYSKSGDPLTVVSNTVIVTVTLLSQVAISPLPNDTILPGQTASETITVTNQGNGTDTINLQATSTAGFSEQFFAADGVTPLTDTNGDGRVDTGPLAPGASLVVTLVISAPASVTPGTTDNSVITGTSTSDPAIAASITRNTTVIAPRFWDSLIKSVSPTGQITPSTVLVYTNTFANSGTDPATNVVITDQLDANLLYQSGSATLPADLAGATVGYDPATRTISWRIPSVPPGYFGSIGFRAQVDPATPSDTTIVNSIAITSDQNLTPQVSNAVSSQVVEQPLRIAKQAGKTEVEPGGIVNYTVTVDNISSSLTARAVTVADRLPHGFRYVNGSSAVDKAAAADPPAGATSSWLIGDIPPGERRLLTYRSIASIDAPLGDAVNAALATGTTPAGASLTSGVATARVKVVEGVLNSKATILGRVFVDNNRDLMPDAEEPGIKGVRLYLEDGSYVVTDGEGKFSFSGVEAGDHVLKIDRTTIPADLEPEPLDSSFAGDGNSRFVSVPFGGMGRGDFGLIAKKGKIKIPPPAPKKEEKIYVFGTEAAALPEPLEKRITTMPDSPEILDPPNGALLRSQSTDIIVRMPDGASFSLLVNKQPISPKQIGKKIVEKSRKIRICQFVGVKLDQGRNRIVLEVTRTGGRTEVKEIEVIVPGDPAKVLLTPAKIDLPANGTATARFSVSLLDKWDRPVMGDHVVTVLTEKGEVLEKNLDPSQKGHHLSLVDGRGSFTLRSGSKTGADKIRVVVGTDLYAEADLFFTPVPREWLVAGIGSLIAGYAVNSGNASGTDVRGKREEGLFEDGRFAFFAKGGVVDKYLLTAAYDTDNRKRNELFQRSAPDKYYPIYGDSAEKGYDAESQNRKFVKIEKDRSAVLYGDFKTDLAQTEFSRYDRTFNGFKADIDTGQATLRAFGSSTNHAVNRDELPGNGTSGYYYLSKKPIIENTEKIRIEVRDRFHTEQVISTRDKLPYVDYSFDFYTGAILFREPVPSLDANLNPVRIVVMYETETPGDDRYIYGGRGALRSAQGSELGFTAIVEEKGVANDTLYGVDGKVVLNEKSVLKVEAAQSRTVDKGDGVAWKTEFGTQIDKTRLDAYVRRIDTTFRNPSMSGTEVGTEKYGIKGSYRLSDPTLLLGESFYQSDLLSGTRLVATSAGVSRKIDTYTVDAGAKYLQSRELTGKERSAPMLYAGVGGKLSDRLDASLLREQAFTADTVKDYPTRTVAKASYRLTQQTAAFLTQELQESGDNRKNSTVAGIATKLSDRTTITTSYQATTGFERSSKAGTEVASKWEPAKDLTVTGKTGYAMENTMTGERGQALLGVDTAWQATKDLRMGLKAERVQLVSGTSDPAGVNTAFALSSDYLVREDVKIGGRYELRVSPNETTNLITSGGAWKLTREFSLLGKASYWISDKPVGTDTLFDGQIGGAYRPLGKDSLYLLGMVRYKADSKGSVVDGGDSDDLIGSVELSRRVSPRLTFHNKYAGKMSWYDGSGIDSSVYTDMLLAGVIYDLTQQWDLSIDAKLMNQYQTGLTSFGIIPKVSYLIQKNLKLGIGYNLSRLNDQDLSGESYQSQGPFVELKFKFDEVTIEELYRNISGTPRLVKEPAPPLEPPPPPRPPTVAVILKATLSEDPVELHGNARSLKFLINDREVVLPVGDDVTVLSESADEVIDIKGSELSKPLEFRIAVAKPANVSSWLLAISSLDGTPLQAIRGEGDPGAAVSWDGRVENGAPLKGGDIYQYQLEVEYQDGTHVTSPLRRFGLNRTSMISVSLSGGAFVTDSAVLSKKARKILSETAVLMRKFTEEKIVIEGHTDAVGSVKYNIGLSRRRSQSAADYLINIEKIPAERLIIRWFGKSRPLASNKIAEGRALNRRVDVKGEFRDQQRPEIVDQSRVAPFVRINRDDLPLDQTGRFFSKLAGNSDRVEIEMGDENGRAVRKALDLPNMLLLEPAGGETRIIHQLAGYSGASAPPALKLAYTFTGSVTKNSRLTFDGKDIPLDPEGKFSLTLELHEGENVFWLKVISPEGYGKYVKMAATLTRENGVTPLTPRVEPSQLAPPPGPGSAHTLVVPISVEPPEQPIASPSAAAADQKLYTLGFGEYLQIAALEAAKAKLAAAGLHPEVQQGDRMKDSAAPAYQLFAGSFDSLRLAVLEAARLEQMGFRPLVVEASR
jgi:uncharacterized repeat protein (TIGR01451 family)